jgi:hypothetical protein
MPIQVQVSALKLQPRTSAPDFASLGLLATRDDERGVRRDCTAVFVCTTFARFFLAVSDCNCSIAGLQEQWTGPETPESRKQLLHTFEESFNALLEVYQALASSGRLEEVVFSDAELQQLCNAFTSMNTILDTTPATPLFGEDTIERLGEVLHCCGQQALSAMHDHLSTLHDAVRPLKSVPSSRHLPSLPYSNLEVATAILKLPTKWQIATVHGNKTCHFGCKDV